jgi:hypothetical protein
MSGAAGLLAACDHPRLLGFKVLPRQREPLADLNALFRPDLDALSVVASAAMSSRRKIHR